MFIHRFVLALIRLNWLGKKKQIQQIIKILKNLQNIKTWNPLKAQEFIESLNVNNFNDLSEKLNNINPEEINQVNTCTSDLCHLFISAAKNTFGTRSVYKGKPKIVKGDEPWLKLDCKFARQNYGKLKRKKKLYPEEINNAEKHYKKTLDSNLKKTPEGNVKAYDNFTKRWSERILKTFKYWKVY